MNCKKYNYTLIEMLTVIAIICILAGLLIPAVNIARERGRETSATAGCNTIATAIRQYNMTYSKMPNVTIEQSGDVYLPVGGSVEPDKKFEDVSKDDKRSKSYDRTYCSTFSSTSPLGSGTATFYKEDSKSIFLYDRIIFILTGQLPKLNLEDDEKEASSDAFKYYNRKKIAFLEAPADYLKKDGGGFYANPWGERYYIVYNTTGANRMEFRRPSDGRLDSDLSTVTIGSDVAVFSEVNPGSKDFKDGKRLATSWKGITTF